jgi:ubiquinone/menaquinone biosynthesis C-methylase UbiE
MDDKITQSIRKSYDQLSDEYARRLFNELQNKPLDRQLLGRFAVETAGRGKVCDIGCGPGQVARYLHDAGADVFGLDISPGMLEATRQLSPDIDFEEGNMMALDLGDGTLAGIAAFYAIVNIPEGSLPRVVREMERVLQVGGLFVACISYRGRSAPGSRAMGPAHFDEFLLIPDNGHPAAPGSRRAES